MPALGPVQLGPTGRSVARSYSAALSKLVPKGATYCYLQHRSTTDTSPSPGTTVGIDIADPNNLTDAEKRYAKAMTWLTQEDERLAPDGVARTYLQTYIYYQAKYTKEFEKRLKRQNKALDQAIKQNTTTSAQRAAFDRWMSENGRQLNNTVEGAWKDWVVHGRKEATEYWFSLVDNDSAMARVELSKVCFISRESTDSYTWWIRKRCAILLS